MRVHKEHENEKTCDSSGKLPPLMLFHSTHRPLSVCSSQLQFSVHSNKVLTNDKCYIR